MARGYPDYNRPVYNISMKNVDVNSLIAQSFGITPCDGKGRLIYAQRFSEGLGDWGTILFGNAQATTVSTDAPEIAPVSVNLKPGSAAGFGTLKIGKHFEALGVDRVGFEVGLRDAGQSSYMDAVLEYEQGSLQYHGRLRLDIVTGLVYLRTNTTFASIGQAEIPVARYSFQAMKVVCDFSTGLWVRAIVGQTEFNVEGQTLYHGIELATQDLVPFVQITARGATNTQCYLGHIFLTLDEP